MWAGSWIAWNLSAENTCRSPGLSHSKRFKVKEINSTMNVPYSELKQIEYRHFGKNTGKYVLTPLKKILYLFIVHRKNDRGIKQIKEISMNWSFLSLNNSFINQKVCIVCFIPIKWTISCWFQAVGINRSQLKQILRLEFRSLLEVKMLNNQWCLMDLGPKNNSSTPY